MIPALNRAVHGLLGAATRPRLLILIFHRVHAQADPLAPHEPDAARFDALLGLLRRSFRVLALGPAVAALREGTLPSRALAITFDDGYADNAEVALPLLRKHGLPATFFVATGFLDGAGCMWNDRLIESVRATRCARADFGAAGIGLLALDGAQQRQHAIDVLIGHAKYLAPDARTAFVADAQRTLAVTGSFADLMMSAAQVRALHAGGMENGAHTMAHPILARLDDAACRAEIEGGRTRLAQIIDAPVDLFAYPNGKPGRDYEGRHVELVRRLGFRAAVSTAPGAAARGDDLFQLPRYTPWGPTPARWSALLLRNRMQRSFATA